MKSAKKSGKKRKAPPGAPDEKLLKAHVHKGSRAPSWVWSHYWEYEDHEGWCVCRECKAFVAGGKCGTTGLADHLRDKHKIQEKTVISLRCCASRFSVLTHLGSLLFRSQNLTAPQKAADAA
jgi:hypothetical protein